MEGDSHNRAMVNMGHAAQATQGGSTASQPTVSLIIARHCSAWLDGRYRFHPYRPSYGLHGQCIAVASHSR